MLKSSAVSRAYQELWQQFAGAVDAAGHKWESRTPQVSMVGSDAEISVFAYLQGWRWKANSTKAEEKVEILLRVKEKLDTKTGRVMECSTQIGYYSRQSASDVKPTLEIHYDFERTTPSAHPVFHAQVGHTNWDEKEKKDVGFAGQILPSPWYKNARIPTAYMGFSGALLALTADHLKDEHFYTFLSAVQKSSCANDWGPRCPNLSAALRLEGATPQAFHWYEQAPPIKSAKGEKEGTALSAKILAVPRLALSKARR